jgi:hypothetical protein
MLRAMWVLPLVAAAVAFVFAALLGRRFAARRQGYQLVWAIALVMYGLASLAVAAAALNGWSERGFEIYWAFGAVLNVPFLAAGELQLLIRNRAAHVVLYVVVAVITVYTFSVLRRANLDPAELAERLPSGKDVFGAGSDAHRLPQLISIPSYLILLGGALWSAWRMRGRPELRDRCYGTLLIAAGATLIAGFGSAFAATGNLPWFSIALLAGISVMFAGFLRASRPARSPASPAVA